MPNSQNALAGTSRGQWFAVAAIAMAVLIAAVFLLRTLSAGELGGGKAIDADEHASLAANGPAGTGASTEASTGAKGPTVPGNSAGHQEGKIPFTDAQVAAAGVRVEPAGPARIASSVQLPGEIRFNDDRTAHVVPRVAGIVESVAANLGQQVKKGQVLAVISSAWLSEQRSELLAAQKRLALARTTAERERKLFEDRISAQQDHLLAEQALREAEITVANLTQKLKAIGADPAAGSLTRYELRAPFDGMVVEKHLALGEAVREDANVFTVSDLSTVWAQISVSATHLSQVRIGQKATIHATGFDQTATGSVAYIGALLGEQTRAATARVTLANPALAWRPGLFVTVELVAGTSEAPVSVAVEAMQTIAKTPTVFVKVDGGFEARAVQPGRSDGQRVEILSGLAAGTPHAASGSYAVKAEMGKGSADHGH